MAPCKRFKMNLVRCIHQRELGLLFSQQSSLLNSFVEEKASLPNRNQPCEVSGQTRSTVLMEFSSDGKRIASTHGDHSIRVTDIRTGRCTHTLTGHPRTPWCIAFHPSNNDILGSGCLGGEVRIWDLQGGGSEVWNSDDTLSIASLTFHPSDNVVVFAVSNKLHFWDWTRSEPFAVCETTHDFEKIRWVKFDCIGQQLLTAIANATDEAYSDMSSFPLFSEHTTDSGRYSSGGAVDVSQHLDNVGSFYQMHRMSANDDSLMDLRTGWRGNRNSTMDNSRSLSSARQYAHDVTRQAHRLSLDSGSRFVSGTAHSLPHAGLEGRCSSQQDASSLTDVGVTSLSTKRSPFLSSAVSVSEPPVSSSAITDWLPSSSQERELEAGNALLTLSADGCQTPSRYIRNLSGNNSQQHFLIGDDPLSENLSLLEPGYVEVLPADDQYEVFSARMSASSPTPTRAEELLRESVILNLEEEQAAEIRQRSNESGSDLFLLSSYDQPPQNMEAFRVESQSSIEPTSGRNDEDADHDIWFNPSTRWGVQHSSSLSLFCNQQNSARVNHEPDQDAIHLSSTNSGSGRPMDMLMLDGESGLDLRFETHLSSQDHDGSVINPLEHSYALPVSRGSNEIYSTTIENVSSASEEMEVPVQQEITSSFVNSSSIFHTENTSIWMTAPSQTSVNLAATMDNDQNLNLASLGHYTVSSTFSNSREAVNDVGGSRTANTQRTDQMLNSSSARCRLFLPFCNGMSSSTSGAAIDINSLAGTMSASVSSHRARRQAQVSRQHELRHLRRSQVNDSVQPSSHCLNSVMPPLGCSVCNSLNVSQIYDPHPRLPTSSRTEASASSEHPQSIRSSRDVESPIAGYFQSLESTPSTSDNHLPVTETLRDLDSLQQELNGSGGSEPVHGRPSAARYSCGPRPRLLNLSDSSSSLDGSTRPGRVIPHIEVYSGDLDDRVRSPDEQIPQTRQHYLEPGIYRSSSHLNSSHFTSISERLRERQERINFHVEELRSRFGLGSSTLTGSNRLIGGNSDSTRVSGPLDDDLFSFQNSSPRFGSGADAVGETLGNEDRTRIVNRLRGFREEIRAMRLEMFRNNQRDQERISRNGYRHYMPLRQFRNNRDALLSGDIDGQRVRMHAALNRAISGALVANGESSVGSNVVDQTYRIQAWDFIKCQIPDLTNSESNILVRRAKIHNDANVDVSQDGRYLCTFIQPNRNFSGDIMLSVFSLMTETLGECLFTKSFGPNAISVSISPCNRYVLVGLATKRFTWMFTPKQMVAQVYQLKTPRAEEDSMEHVCDITHPCDMDFRAPISMNSAKWLLGPGEGLAYGTNRGDLNIYRPGFDQIEKPEVNDMSESNPIRRNLMQMLGLTVPRMMSTATQTSLNLRRSASTQTEQNSHSASSSSSTGAILDQNHASNMDTEDLNLF